VIEAIQWTGDNLTELQVWGAPVCFPPTLDPEVLATKEIVVSTLEDGSKGQVQHMASLGDWIIRGVQGEFYACKPDIFVATYEVHNGN